MPEDRSQRARARRREIDLGTEELKQQLYSMIEWETVSGVSSGDSAAPTADTDDGDDLEVLEPYGFASRPDGNGTTLAVAPGGEVQGRVALGVSSPGGRPATDAGDTALWCVAGHTILLDNDSDLNITSKDGAVIVLPVSGGVDITAGPGASVNVNVDVGAFVNIGGAGAVALALGQKVIDGVDGMLAAGIPVLGDGGANLLATMTSGWNLLKAAILAQKAKGE